MTDYLAMAEEYGMTVYTLGLLKRGPAWTPDATPAVEALQEAHLANINRMHEAGWLAAVGPLLDDSDLRGIYLFNTASLEQAEEWANSDPAIRAGRLVCELHPWMTGKDVFRAG